MKTLTFIPSTEIPHAPAPLNDHDAGFTAPCGFHHSLNSLGYRSQEFCDKGKYNILTLGCSYAFGWCLPIELTWAQLLCDKLSESTGAKVSNWNLSLPGGSNDYICRMLLSVLPILKPDLVLVAFSQLGRLEYWVSPDRVFGLRPTTDPPNLNWGPERLQALKQFTALQNEWHDQSRLYNTFRLIELFLERCGIDWLYTYACVIKEPLVAQYLNRDHYIGQVFPRFDFASDGIHPGPKSNAELAGRTWDCFERRFNRMAVVRPPDSTIEA